MITIWESSAEERQVLQPGRGRTIWGQNNSYRKIGKAWRRLPSLRLRSFQDVDPDSRRLFSFEKIKGIWFPGNSAAAG